MNYLLVFGIIGLIVVIALAAYFMLVKKDEPIKDGKYTPRDVAPGTYIIVSKDKVEFWGEENKPPPQVSDRYKLFEINIVKSDMKVPIDGKEKITYKSTTLLENKELYMAQSLSGNILFYTKEGNNLVRIPEMEYIKVE